MQADYKTLFFALVLLVAGCDSQPQPVRPVDAHRIDELRTANEDIVNNRKARCDDLLPTLENSELSQKMWNSLQCPTLYTTFIQRDQEIAAPVEEQLGDQQEDLTRVQSGAIGLDITPQN